MLRCTGNQREPESIGKVPRRLQAVVSRLGIDLTIWLDFVWNFKRYYSGPQSRHRPPIDAAPP